MAKDTKDTKKDGGAEVLKTPPRLVTMTRPHNRANGGPTTATVPLSSVASRRKNGWAVEGEK